MSERGRVAGENALVEGIAPGGCPTCGAPLVAVFEGDGDRARCTGREEHPYSGTWPPNRDSRGQPTSPPFKYERGMLVAWTPEDWRAARGEEAPKS